MARTVTISPATPEPPVVRTVKDMSRGDICQIVDWLAWYRRTDNDEWPLVRIDSGALFTQAVLGRKISRVLQPGETLTMGPEE